MKIPDVIYLQAFGDEPTTYTDDDDNEVTIPEEDMDVDLDSVTWCSDRIYEGDIEYVRSDRYREAVELIARTHTEPVTARWYEDARAFLVKEEK